PPHAAVADDLDVAGLAAEDDVVRAVPGRQLAVIGVARPGCGEDVALDLLDDRHVHLSHGLDRKLLANLDHAPPTAPCRTNACIEARPYHSQALAPGPGASRPRFRRCPHRRRRAGAPPRPGRAPRWRP